MDGSSHRRAESPSLKRERRVLRSRFRLGRLLGSYRMKNVTWLIVLLLVLCPCSGNLLIADDAKKSDPQPLPGTAPLTMEGDIASHLVAGVDKFLLRKI